jgi:hypothetical protein
MSRTIVDNATGDFVQVSGNWETPTLGRVACLMLGKHYYKMTNIGDPGDPEWLNADQAYSLDGPECQEFAQALINVTDEVVEKVRPYACVVPETTLQEMKECIIEHGEIYRKLKKGYRELD